MRVLGARAARPVASSPRAPRKRRPCRSRAALRTAPAPPGNPGAPSAASASAGGCSGWGRPEGASFPGAPRAKGTFWPLPHPRALSGVVLPSPAEVSWAPEAVLSDGECSGFSGTCASGCGLFSPVSPLENADRDLHPQELEEHHRKGSAALPGLPAPPSDQPDARGGSQGPAEVLSTKRQVLSSTAWRASSGGHPAQPGLSKQSGLEGFQLWLRKPCLQCICSSALDMWEVMLCMPRTLEKVLKELTKGSQLSRLLEGVTEDTCILFLAVSYWITLCCPSGLCVPLQALTGVFVSANGKE